MLLYCLTSYDQEKGDLMSHSNGPWQHVYQIVFTANVCAHSAVLLTWFFPLNQSFFGTKLLESSNQLFELPGLK